MSGALVSVLVPTYSQVPGYLSAAIQSARLQTVPVEVCVCDDGSDPSQEEVAHEAWREYGDGCVKYAWQPNGGVAAALNACLEMATCEWVAWLPSDDLFQRDHLKTMVDALDPSGNQVGYCSYEEGIPIPQARWPAAQFPSREKLFEALQKGCFINAATLVWHRSVFDQVGAWDASFPFCQDYEHILRCAEVNNFLAVHHYGVRRRVHPKQLTQTLINNERATAKQAEHDRLANLYGSSGVSWTPR